jgi:glucose dehydrogenase
MAMTVPSAAGSLLWQDVLNPTGGSDIANWVEVAGGRTFAAGQVRGVSTGLDFGVRAYDGAGGALLWEDRIDRLGAGDAAFWVGESDGRVAAVGFLAGDATCRWIDSGNCDLYVRAYEASTGAVLWEDRADYGGGADFAASAAAGGGRVVVVGYGTGPAGDTDFWVRAYDGASGALLWEDRTDRAAGDDGAQSVEIRGRLVLVSGFASGDATCDIFSGTGNCDFLVRAYDGATGALLWEDQTDAAGALDWAQDVDVRGNLAVAVGLAGAGASCNPRRFQGDCDLLVRAYDAHDGRLLWADRADYAGGMDAGLAVTLRGDVVGVAGMGGASDLDMVARAYDAKTGALLWQDRVDGAGENDFGWNLSAEADALYVVGSLATSSSGDDLLLRAYDLETGVLRWQDLQDVAGSSDLLVAVDAREGVISAAGYQTNANGDSDFLVRTYGTTP